MAVLFRRVAASILVVMATFAATPVPAAAAAPPRPFCDVSHDAWYAPAVEWAKSVGITAGVSATEFDGDGPTTRGQLVTLLHRYVAWRDGAAPIGGDPHRFADVAPHAFYAPAVGWAAARGITTGVGSGRFAPERATTRAELAVFVHRLEGRPAGPTTSPFVDVADGDWFGPAVEWLASTGITTGTAPDRYSPHASSTRAEIVTFLFRLAGQPAPGPFAAAPCPRTYTAVGDSVMGGTRTGAHLTPTTFPGWIGTIDAHGCRQAFEDWTEPSICGAPPILSHLSVVEAARDAGTLGEVVIIHAGTNGPLTASTFDRIVEAAAGADTVWFMTVRTPWFNGSGNNAAIRAGVERWEQRRDVRLLDWWARTADAPELLDPADRFHLTDLGRVAYTDMIGMALAAS